EEASGRRREEDYSFVSVSGQSHRLHHLEKFTVYTVAVQAFNSKGAGVLSRPVRVSTLEDVPSESPVGVRCRAEDPHKMKVSWKPAKASRINGILKGYRVVYEISRDVHGKLIRESQVFEREEATLEDLHPDTNYTVAVLAFNGRGEGPPSDPIYCLTLPDVPDAPEAVRVHVGVGKSLVVAWKEPRFPNGNILHYVLYVYRGHTSEPEVEILPSSMYHHTVHGLDPGTTLAFQVEAVNSVGGGERSPLVHGTVPSTPDSPRPPVVLTFPRTVRLEPGESVVFPCDTLGDPEPHLTWTSPRDGKPLSPLIDKALFLGHVTPQDEGAYRCTARNPLGTDDLVHRLHVIRKKHPRFLRPNRTRLDESRSDERATRSTPDGSVERMGERPAGGMEDPARRRIPHPIRPGVRERSLPGAQRLDRHHGSLRGTFRGDPGYGILVFE
ncbi:unnamed protein product, partial [Darwinula stevensoni]